jgi:uncharacterized protein (TIGR04255 family)
MLFPDSPRVVYERNPLAEVICQLRFPAILRIETEPPAAFQERIRGMFPLFKESAVLDLVGGLPPELSRFFSAPLPLPSRPVAYEFTSVDGFWTAHLGRESLGLTCRRYERWEGFRDRLDAPLRALLETYGPAFFSRIGLRYRDVIRRSVLGLQDVPWGELLNRNLAGPLGLPDLAPQVTQVSQAVVFNIPDDRGQVRMLHGLGTDATSGEPCYMIDCDLYDETNTETANAFGKLNSFNRLAGRLFRWCITERLHRAMGPSPI